GVAEVLHRCQLDRGGADPGLRPEPSLRKPEGERSVPPDVERPPRPRLGDRRGGGDERQCRGRRGDHTRAMSGTIRPSSTMFAFHSVKLASSSSGSWPRSASRTGWAMSGVTRYWYQEMSQATVITISVLTPERGVIETCGVPRLFAMPPTVRLYCEPLK